MKIGALLVCDKAGKWTAIEAGNSIGDYLKTLDQLSLDKGEGRVRNKPVSLAEGIVLSTSGIERRRRF